VAKEPSDHINLIQGNLISGRLRAQVGAAQMHGRSNVVGRYEQSLLKSF